MSARIFTAKSDVVKVCWRLDGLHLSADIELFYLVAEVSNRRMCRIISTEDLNGLLHLVRSIHVLNCNDVRKLMSSA